MKHMENHTMNGHSKKENTLYSLAQSVKKLTWSHVTLGLSIIAMLFAGFGFVRNTQNANKDIPEIKRTIDAHEKSDQTTVFLMVNTLNEIKLSVKDIQGDIKLVNQKVDDMKAYGVGGEYHRETIKAIERNK